ncbi:ATP-dependent zinc protease family protein [Aurantibacillus circumpalustris]|uniref:ATP-dependent zinc protease family protein n=1 Tax=Aurantibacillus circumpalustris TaxID=3036359 RepID=UPI00295BB1B4|nr:RimK/LysX family protein [Aurantibacillus circumpalustris]
MTIKGKVKLIGRREFVDLPLLGIFGIEAKIDTGAYTSSLHCENISLNYENSKPILYFTIDLGQSKKFRFEEFRLKKIKNSFGEMEERYVIKTLLVIGKKKIYSTISLSNRDNMRYPMLIGRRLLKGKFLIDVNKIHTNGISLNGFPI